MQFSYKDVIDRGFKRVDSHDQIFINEYGFDWFIVTKKLTKHLYLDWDCNTREIEFVLTGKDGLIRNKAKIESIEDLDNVLEFFK